VTKNLTRWDVVMEDAEMGHWTSAWTGRILIGRPKRDKYSTRGRKNAVDWLTSVVTTALAKRNKILL